MNTISYNYIQGLKNTTIPVSRTSSFSFKGICSVEPSEDIFINTSKNKKSDLKVFIEKFLIDKDNTIEEIIKTHNFELYQKNGLPLKYPRKQFIDDIKFIIDDLSESEKQQLLEKFNLKQTTDDIDGIPSIKKETTFLTDKEKELNNLIKKFYYHNELKITDSKVKNSLELIAKGLPEFNMIIGKQQHNTHAYSVDIHSLLVLQKSMNNPLYNELSDESKIVLKLTALLHDFGKKGKVITTGHASVSKEIAEKILENYDISQHIKERVLLQVEHHHWFERYNRGFYSPLKVANIFKTEEDLNVAKILAKSDFESIGNNFHLNYLTPNKYMNQYIFDNEFGNKVDVIEPLEVIEKKYDSFEKLMLEQREAASEYITDLYYPESGLTLLNGIKDGSYTPNRVIRRNINNNHGKATPVPTDKLDGRIIEHLDEVIKTSRIPEDTILYRCASPFDFALYAMDTKTFIDKFYEKGKLFTIPVYTHTARNPEAADKFLTSQARMIYKINAPKGTNGIFMEDLSTSFAANEHEILLPRNLVYKFKNIINKDDKYIVEIDVVPQTHETVHKFWEEADEDYWAQTQQMPDLD